MFTLYHADVTGNPGNCSYPHIVEVTDAASLQAAVCHDYVCAEYRNKFLQSAADHPERKPESPAAVVVGALPLEVG